MFPLNLRYIMSINSNYLTKDSKECIITSISIGFALRAMRLYG